MLLVFGSINVDMLLEVEALPRPGETVLCPGYRLAAGGKGGNQAAAAARAGAAVHMVGQIGDDSFGAFARQALEGAYQAYAVEMLAIPPVVPLEAVQAVIDETLRLNPDAPIREAALLVDNRPLQAVQASGFVDAVLAEYPSAR